MMKHQELTNPAACLQRAKPSEMTFVLLARDVAAPDAIYYWASRRVELGKNSPADPQIVEAYACADFMAKQRPHVAALPASAPVKELDLLALVREYHGWATDAEMVAAVGYGLELYVAKMRRALHRVGVSAP